MKARIVVAVLFLPILFAPTFVPAQELPAGPRKVVVKVAPQYSPLAQSLAIEGTVKAEVVVMPNGTMKSVEFKGGHPLFVQAAKNALNQWRWEPAPRETHETVELKFAR